MRAEGERAIPTHQTETNHYVTEISVTSEIKSMCFLIGKPLENTKQVMCQVQMHAFTHQTCLISIQSFINHVLALLCLLVTASVLHCQHQFNFSVLCRRAVQLRWGPAYLTSIFNHLTCKYIAQVCTHFCRNTVESSKLRKKRQW